MRRAIALYSGGLDSTLAIALMQRAGIEVIPVTFVTPFTSPFSKPGKQDKEAIISKAFGLQLRSVPLREDLIELIKNPKFGRGKNINPCIDCHLLMLQKTKAFMKEWQADFVVTGEVLGQRPMSQHRQALGLVARKSGLEGLLVRPLCAKLLDRTIPQQEGWIAPEYLLDIVGRSRKRQMEMAQEFGLTDYASPAGGCLLTDQGYSRKLRVLLDADMLNVENCHWIQYGRFFDLGEKCKLVIARNEQECKALQEHACVGDRLIWPLNHKGPMALLRGENSEVVLEKALGIVAFYCRDNADQILAIENSTGQRLDERAVVPLSEYEVRCVLIS